MLKECVLRHPKFCKFPIDYGYCKFGQWCYFSYKLTTLNYNANSIEIKELKDELADVNSKIKTFEIETLEQKFSEKSIDKLLDDFMMKMETKIEMFEAKSNFMNMCVVEKDEQIIDPEAKVKSMASKFKELMKKDKTEPEKHSYVINVTSAPIPKVV